MDLISSWDEIVDNCYQFNYAVKDLNSIPHKRFTQFYHWFYFPQYNLFAPSKFIGYKNTTAENYRGFGTGTETTQVLKQYFNKLDRSSQDFKKYKNKLELFAGSLNKKINIKTYQGSGGIYLPKEKYLGKEKAYTTSLYNKVSADLEAQKDEEDFNSVEGAPKERLVRYYERNPKLRARAISFHGFNCKVCGFNFEKEYGERGKDFIEVHHLTPISNYEEETQVDYKTEMTVLCSNCHRMIHRDKNNPLSIEELKNIMK